MVSGSSGKLVWQTVLPEDWSAMRLSLAADTEDPAIHVAGLSHRRAWASFLSCGVRTAKGPPCTYPLDSLVHSMSEPDEVTAGSQPIGDLWLCSGSEMHVWTLAARDGEVQRKKQDRLDAPLQGPVLCKRGHAYAFARDSYWLCRMPLSGAHLRPSGACAVPCSAADPDLAHAQWPYEALMRGVSAA